ncbi:MAG: Ig-like domain-containing protein, partial [Treponemataceae bacterium]
ATAIAVDTPIFANFSETMDSTTINTASFTLKSGASINVAGTVVWNATNNSATFTPSADLTPSTVYTATISAAVKDSSGTVMASDKVWTFTTAAGTTGTSHALLNWDFQDSGSYDSPTIYTTGGQTVTDILPGWTLSYGVNSAVSLQINIGNEATNNYAILKQTAGASGNAIYMEQNPAYTITSTSKLKVRFQMKSNQSGSTYYYDCSAFSVLFTVSGIQYLVLIRSDAAHVSSGDTRPGTQTAFNVWYTAEIPLAGMQTLQMHLNNVNTGTPTTLSVGDVISTVTVRVNNDIYETWIDYVDIQ